MKKKMTKKQYDEACRYANADLDPDSVNRALRLMDEWRTPLYATDSAIDSHISEKMDEWCKDHDIETDAWREWGDEEAVFFNAE